MTRTLTLILAAALISGLIGCTRTVYIVQAANGDEIGAFDDADAAQEAARKSGERTPETKENAVEEEGEVEEVADGAGDATGGDDPFTKPADNDGPGWTEAEAEAAIHVGMMPANDFVLIGQDEPVFVQVEFGADSIKSASRAPLSLAIVIDRSGSMSGGKLDQVKDAAFWLIDHLQEGDHVALISYASDVRVDAVETLDAESRFTLRNAVRRLSPGGGTHLSGGLEHGAGELREVLSQERINRVVVLSDGNANEGITDPSQLARMTDRLRETGISVTTMGVGLDYNEDVMQSMATYGGGNYYFIEQAAQLDAVFAAELESLGTLVARDAVLELEIPEDMELREVYGYAWEREGNTLKIPMNAVSSGEKRRLLVALDVKDKKKHTSGGSLRVASGKLSFRNELTKKQQTVDFAPIDIEITDDAEVVGRSYHEPVLEKVEAVRNAEAQLAAIQELERGDRAAAEQIIATRRSQSSAINSSLGGNAVIDTQIQQLDDLQADFEAMPAEKDELDSHRSSSSYKRLKKSRKAAASGAVVY